MWIPSHIGIHGNEIVDAAAKAALTQEIQTNLQPCISYRDLFRKTYSYCSKIWNDSWTSQTSNKLFKFMPKLSEPLPHVNTNRKDQTVLTRLHIGHSYLTHSYLLRKEDPPRCNTCDQLQTIRHILLECTDLTNQRSVHLNGLTEKLIFDHPTRILTFLRDTNLFSRI